MTNPDSGTTVSDPKTLPSGAMSKAIPSGWRRHQHARLCCGQPHLEGRPPRPGGLLVQERQHRRHVGIPVYFYGDAVTTENISNVVNSVQDAWSRQVGQYNLSVTVIVSTAPYAAGAPGEAIGNNVSMVPGVGRSNAGKLHVPPLRDNSYAHEGGPRMGLGHFPLTLMDGDIANNGITEEMVGSIMSSDENFRAGGCGCD